MADWRGEKKPHSARQEGRLLIGLGVTVPLHLRDVNVQSEMSVISACTGCVCVSV